MFRFEKTLTREKRYKHKRDNPSFSSSLLDQICRSIDDNDGIADTKNQDLKKFNRETMQKKQSSKGNMKWMEKKVFEQSNPEKNQVFKEFNKINSHHNHNHKLDYYDQIFFSSSSSSSDSSSGCFSFSDTESMYGTKTKKAPCLFVPQRPNPVRRTSVSAAPPHKPLFTTQSNFPMFDDHRTPKSRGAIKQPISPGARLASFINSLFTTVANNTKKAKNPSPISRYDEEISSSTTCYSASSFSRSSCLSKNSLPTREKSSDGVKRTVRFCPASVIVGEEDKGSRLLPVSVPTAWKIGKSLSRKCENEVKYQVMEKSKRVEGIGREFIKGYNQNHQKNSHYVVDQKLVEDDDDAASDSSSDLFELDHLVLTGNRYREELPVYETTRVQTNRAIANGFIV